MITGIIIAVSQLIPGEVEWYSSLSGPEPGATKASMRTKSMEDESEATTTKIYDASVRLGRHHDAGRVQEESGAPATTTPAPAGRAYGFADGQPEHGG